MKLAIHTEWILFLVMLGIFGIVLVTGTCLVLVFRRSAKACTTAACLSSAQKRQTWALWAMIIGLGIFGLAWVSFLMRYRLAQIIPAVPEATPLFPGARNIFGVLPAYNPLQGRTGDPTQIQAVVAAYFQSHPTSQTYRQPDTEGRTMLHWAAYGLNDTASFQGVLEKMPELVNQKDINGDTPLILAIEHGNSAASQLLTHPITLPDPDHPGTTMMVDLEPNQTNHYGITALMYAAYFNMTAVCELLAPLSTQEQFEAAQKIAASRSYESTRLAILNHPPPP